MEFLADPQTYISFAVLALMEVVLGIDNIVFITILCGRLPAERQARARQVGLMLAVVGRIGLLLGITWVMRLRETLFELIRPWSGKDLILMGGGLFLLYKATREIYANVEQPLRHSLTQSTAGPANYGAILAQVMLLDLVFSLDSVITAVGMVDADKEFVGPIVIMASAMVCAVIVMVAFAGPLGDFIEKHPSIKVLALSFLMLIGVMLMAEGTGLHMPKGYIYSAMGFSLAVQLLTVRMGQRAREHGGV